MRTCLVRSTFVPPILGPRRVRSPVVNNISPKYPGLWYCYWAELSSYNYGGQKSTRWRGKGTGPGNRPFLRGAADFLEQVIVAETSHPEHRTSGLRSQAAKKPAHHRHSERSEESRADGEMLRFAQDDVGALGMTKGCFLIVRSIHAPDAGFEGIDARNRTG